ncbi:Predicted Zn peptidase [Clostridium paraputrificum]|uniref:ImmA/IrrE family metallo-endopeptidase n=1 Tax=Clostridium paraputrificum TaxID=29363 RepID=UPI0006C5ECB2|nr:ImmA/IrrE family metallo-endopeptidase [Clostridium paraputrificum]CUQ09953.1 Predicted Zn peptidase [Clostridium paraputrificum]
MANDYIKRVIENLKNKYKTTCPFEITKDLGITLIVAPLGNVWGMYKYIKRTKVIYLNESLNEYEKRFVLAHELGHAVLHPKSTCFFTDTKNLNKIKKEHEANIFAANFLIDTIDVDKSYLEGYSINQLAAYYKVPVDLIEFKFKNLHRKE